MRFQPTVSSLNRAIVPGRSRQRQGQRQRHAPPVAKLGAMLPRRCCCGSMSSPLLLRTPSLRGSSSPSAVVCDQVRGTSAFRRPLRWPGAQGLLEDSPRPGIDIGRPSRVFPVTPPCVRVRTRRFKLVMSWVSIGDSVSPGPRRPRQAVPSTGLGCDSAAMDRVPYEPCRLPEGATLLETPVAGIGFGARPTASRPCTEGVCEPSRPGREAPTDSGRTRSRPASPAGIVPADKLQPPGSYHTSDRSSSARAA